MSREGKAWRSLTDERDAFRREAEEANRAVRTLTARLQEREDSSSGPGDAEGVGLRPAVTYLRDRNFSQVIRFVNVLPSLPFYRRKDAKGLEFGPPLGFDGSVDWITWHLAPVVDSVSVSAFREPLQFRDWHRLKMTVHEPSSYYLLMPDRAGAQTRSDLLDGVATLGLAPSMRKAFEMSQEIVIDPVEAERKGYR